MNLTGKQRSHLKSLAAQLDATLQIGKEGVLPSTTTSVEEAFNTRELLKLNVLKSCLEDPQTIAETIGERTHSTVVQVIGRKIVLYKPFKDNPVIRLPK